MVLILDASTLTYQSFRAQCLVPNRPALIRNALSKFHPPPFPRDAVEAPECTLPLSSSSSFSPAVSSVLTPEGLLNYFGSDHTVPVYYHPLASAAVVGRGEEAASKNDERKQEDHVECSDVTVSSTMSLQEVLTRWALYHQRNTSLNSNDPTDPDVQPQQEAMADTLNWLYLMNWHFQQEWESHFLHNNTSTSSSCISSNDDVGSNPKAPSKPCCTNRAIGSVAGLYEVPSFLGPDLMHPYFCRVKKAAEGETRETATRPQQQTGEASAAPTTAEQPSSSTLRGFGNGQEDYRFAYLGLPGSWTPCHYDVFGTYSWSLNLSGTKLWYFLTETSQAQVIPFSVGSAADSRSSDEHDDARKNEAAWRFRVGTPLAADLRVMSDVELDSFEQQAGDLVFVPSCYIHQVHNLDGPLVPIPSPTSTSSSSVPWVASINHND